MKNRYGDHYDFELIAPNQYKIVGNLQYWRFGGQPDQPEVDLQNLGFVDPSGGPFISPGHYKICGRQVTRIFTWGRDICFEVGDE